MSHGFARWPPQGGEEGREKARKGGSEGGIRVRPLVPRGGDTKSVSRESYPSINTLKSLPILTYKTRPKEV
jgi:hypothetical protein